MSTDADSPLSGDDDADPGRVRVGVAELAVASGDSLLATSGVGSCVGVAVADPSEGVAGLAHVMLPERADAGEEGTATDESVETSKPAKSAVSGVENLLAAVEEAGGNLDSVEAKLAGGSRMFDFSGVSEGVGRRNVEAVRTALDERDVDVVAEDVGGSHGRSLRVDPESWTLTVTSAHDGEVVL
ncbi:chemotaxis protein CheD [Halorussus litoreus]|uniref:chemotaxis protein CheD n=1 Tax=Halorussus litoreus TaxID=1710536 RepID=UPI000E23BBAB|nr:chemotaxis protein CheD [Halorussus litoreus]